MSKISRYICAALLTVSIALPAAAQQPVAADSANRQQPVRGIQYTGDDLLSQKPLPLFSGVSVSADLAGGILAIVSPYGQYEAAARVNLYGRFFPTLEIGWGVSDHTDEGTEMHYKTGAPYFRIGCDYNFARDIHSGNRILGGVRYGYSSFDYDLSGPDIIDPVYGTATPYIFKDINSAAHWIDLVFGLEAKVWGSIHLGWSVRYRLRLSSTDSELGEAWYVPGFGRNGGSTLSGTFNVILDI